MGGVTPGSPGDCSGVPVLEDPEAFPVKASWGKFLGPFRLPESLAGGEGPWAENCKPLGVLWPLVPHGTEKQHLLPSFFLHSLILTPLQVPPGLLGLKHLRKSQPWGHGFPCCLLQPFLQEAPNVEESPRKRVGELVLPGNWDPPRGDRGVCARPRREPQTVCGWWVEGVSGVGHWMRALIHRALPLCQTVLALYRLSHLTFKRKPQDAISMPIWRKRKLRLTPKPLKWNCEHTWCHARAHCCSLADTSWSPPPLPRLPPSFDRSALSPSRNVPDSFPCLGIQAFHKTSGLGAPEHLPSLSSSLRLHCSHFGLNHPHSLLNNCRNPTAWWFSLHIRAKMLF